jgi:uncharacterized membrane protein YccF (DUF307 family)
MAGPEQDVAQEPEGGERPWEQLGTVRRDCEPHRGKLLLGLGGVAVLSGVVGFGIVAPSLIGLPLGIAVWVLAERDLVKMRSGLMDPGGLQDVQNARRLAVLGLILSALCLVLCGLPLLVLTLARPSWS